MEVGNSNAVIGPVHTLCKSSRVHLINDASAFSHHG